MTNQLALAMNEYMKMESVPSPKLMQKYSLTTSEFWGAYIQLKAKAPR